MSVRVTLVAAARSSATLAERFDDDRPLDQAGWHEVRLVAHALVPLAAAELRYCSPTPRSRATGEALGYAPLSSPPSGTATWAAGAAAPSRTSPPGNPPPSTPGSPIRAPPRTAASHCWRSSPG